QLLDQAEIHQPGDGAVEGAGMQRDAAARAARDGLHDVVAVAILLGQREQDLEGERRQGQQGGGVSSSGHRSLDGSGMCVGRVYAQGTYMRNPVAWPLLFGGAADRDSANK